MAYTPPTYAPSGSIFGTTAATTPYTYGNLLPSTSSYNIWGSKGNPYITAGPTYTPGSGAPIVPYNYRPYVAPTNTGGGDSFVEPTPTTRYPNNYEIVEGQPLETGSEFITSNGDIDWGGIGNPDYTTVDGVGVTNPDGFYGDGTSSATSSATGKGEGFSFGDLFSTPNVGNVLGAITTYGTPYGLVGTYLGGKAWENYMTTDGKGVDIVDKSFGYGTDNPNGTAPTNNGWGSKGFTGDLFNTSTGRGLATPATFGSTNTPEAIAARAGIATQQANLAALQAERNASPTNGFTPTDTITGDTGSWTNPAAGTDTSTLGGATGTTNASVSWSDNTDSGGNTTGTFTSDEMGTTGVTDYGSGQYSIDVGEKDEVGWEDPGGDSSSSDSGGDSKIICTAMNADYGFGSYRNAIWLRYAALNFSDKPEMELGYHALVLPMLKIRKKWYGKPLYAWLKHVAVHRTADLKAEMYGKERDRIGQVWRFFLEPLCYVTGILINKLKGDK